MSNIIYNNKEYQLESKTIKEAAMFLEPHKNICAGIVNGHMCDLKEQLYSGTTLEFVEKESEDGRLIYQRTLCFLFATALELIYPGVRSEICHSYADGFYCKIHMNINEKDIEAIRDKMSELIQNKEEINSKLIDIEDAASYFEQKGLKDKADMIRYKEKNTCTIYELCKIKNYFYGILLPDASYIKTFSLLPYEDGLWLSLNKEFKPQPKLFEVIQTNEAWGEMMHVSTVAQLNHFIEQNKMNELIAISETLIETRLAQLTNIILQREHPVKLIFISGPSSSGKTTFANRLAIHLKIHGKKPFTISMDDFYLDRKDTPKLEDGSYDFENIETLDLSLFHQTLDQLLALKEVHMPRYNFITGNKEFEKDTVKIDEQTIIIIEGIHGLNPRISKQYKDNCFKIYINALTHLNLDEHNRIPTSDYRLIRRIVRDHQFRGYSASQTLQLWKKVREGENKYIFTYQEEADFILNTSMVYEMAILKKIAMPLLREIPENHPNYLEANRIRNLLEYFLDGDESKVPSTSILAEFIGNSIFF